MMAAEAEFDAAGQKFSRGSYVIPGSGDVRDRLAKAAEELGITAVALNEMPRVAMHALAVPRIAILHTWTSTQNEGWFRLAFDTLGIPYSYISDHDITPDLKSKYDVIVFPPVGGSAQRVVNGSAGRGDPVPWKATEKYPNMTGPNGAQTDDTRGGMGLEGVVNLKHFIEQGGLFIPITGNGAIPIDYGLVEGLSLDEQPRQLQARGTVLNAEILDKKSPVTYGYDDKLALYFAGSPSSAWVEVGSADLAAVAVEDAARARAERAKPAGAAQPIRTFLKLGHYSFLHHVESSPKAEHNLRAAAGRCRKARVPECLCAGRRRRNCWSAACLRAARSWPAPLPWSTRLWERGTSSFSRTIPCGAWKPAAATCCCSMRH